MVEQQRNGCCDAAALCRSADCLAYSVTPRPSSSLALPPCLPACRRNPEFEGLYKQFTHFNPIQTQVGRGGGAGRGAAVMRAGRQA